MKTKPMLLVLMTLCLPSWAVAMPSLARDYKFEAGYMPSCNACHLDGGGSELAPYGKAFKAAGKNAAAFAKIANTDSDGDGISNRLEIQGKSNPSDKSSTPKAPGDWLDIASLIPREVRRAFPDVLTWLPKDALLTPADIMAAKALGATLSTDDDNTIYIPLVARRPAGTGLIFPAVYQGKTFFLLMITDRQLTIREISVLHADKVPSAKGLSVYQQFAGQSVKHVKAETKTALEKSIETAVRHAGVLLYVRLKGA
ncbi:hypothetical protein DFR26_0318 [Paraperlucidibaca baekdonensis]|uniref:Cytochrome c domain-containing protein n=1 Tax=Paraperlucidibaca baekdonensis TaxID=748120 RepID=A0A3E0H8Q4_9GAMM|nr:thrombospondin type 3 repeat-containing protein [Paraperlucidibaca baekdonensis]REH40119.1 hypothetical protein DFR26_0318 [Paraperlucidibaca baekdonensis]